MINESKINQPKTNQAENENAKEGIEKIKITTKKYESNEEAFEDIKNSGFEISKSFVDILPDETNRVWERRHGKEKKFGVQRECIISTVTTDYITEKMLNNLPEDVSLEDALLHMNEETLVIPREGILDVIATLTSEKIISPDSPDVLSFLIQMESPRDDKMAVRTEIHIENGEIGCSPNIVTGFIGNKLAMDANKFFESKEYIRKTSIERKWREEGSEDKYIIMQAENPIV